MWYNKTNGGNKKMNLETLKQQRNQYAKNLENIESEMARLVEAHGKLVASREQLRGAVAALDNALSAAASTSASAPAAAEQEEAKQA